MKISNYLKTMSAGVQIQLTSTSGIYCRSIVIQASSANTGFVAVGGASCTSGIGIQLVAGDAKAYNSQTDSIPFDKIYCEGAAGDTIRIETVQGVNE